MPIHEKQERWLNRFFPGLVEAIRNLGKGEFESATPDLHGRKGNCIRGVELRADYVLSDKLVIEIRVTLFLKDGEPLHTPGDPIDLQKWKRTYYRLHYGHWMGDGIFRFDLSSIGGHHAHIEPNMKDHVLPAELEQDTKDLDPRKFIEMIAKYREDPTNYYPVKRKKS